MPGTITVACKHPAGLELRLFKMEEFDVPRLGGGITTEKRAVPIPGRTVKLFGFAHPIDKAPNAPIHGGYALTHGVDADFFAEWMAQNADSPIVKNGIVFAAEKHAYAESKAREMAEVKSGLEPIDPSNPGGRMRGIQPFDGKRAA